jgi:hypothetical protein
MRLAIPAFFGLPQTWTDSGGITHNCWQSIQAAGAKVSITVADASFPQLAANNPQAQMLAQQQFDACRALGQKVLGYVSTRTGGGAQPARRSAGDISQQIDDWYVYYAGHLDGIYFDEAVQWYDQEPATGGPQDSSAEAFFGGLIGQLRAGHAGSVAALLAGQTVAEWTVQHADFVVLWEERYAVYLSSFTAIDSSNSPTQIPAWWNAPHYTNRIIHIVWNAPGKTELTQAVDTARQRNAGNVFVLDDRSHGYDHLPPYWPDELSAISDPHGYVPSYQQGDPGNGIGGYDLKSPANRVLVFDYDSTGKADHLVLYRPATGTLWILKNASGAFSPVYHEGDPGSGIGGYDLKSPADRVFAFDYDSSGKLDHLALYRPGTGTIWILKRSGATFAATYHQGDPGNGIGGYDLRSRADQAFAFDYDGSGKLDHLALYRPGTGTIWILKNASGTFSPVYQQGDPGNGIGGYDLKSPADRVFAFDYNRTATFDHLALYRPGTGTIWILKPQ